MLKIVILLMAFSVYNRVMAACPNGTYAIPSGLGSKHDCVALVTTGDNLVSAQYHCRYDYGGNLMSIPNAFVNTFLADLIESMFPNQMFLIGTTNLIGSVWKNIDDGQNTTFTNGGAFPPYTSYCAVLHADGHWGFGWAFYSHPYICGFSNTSPSETG